MKSRCYNPNHKSYKDYGERGITICDEWKETPDAFFDWAVNSGYHEGLSIERIDNDGEYCPKNCKWVTISDQAQNKRNIVYVQTKEGLLPLKKAAELYGLPYATVHWRYKNGHPPDRLFEPVK